MLAPSQTALSSPWSTAVLDLPLYLTPRELAQLLQKSERSLERDRIVGRSIPFKKIGRKVLYSRDDVINYLSSASFKSTQEAKAARTT